MPSAALKKPSTTAKSAVGVPLVDPKAAAKAAKKLADVERKAGAQLWYETTKIVVPAWFGQHSAKAGMKKAESLPPHALLALVAIGGQPRAEGQCEVGMQMMLRPSGFDREEARALADDGFGFVVRLKLAEGVPGKEQENMDSAALWPYRLTTKGQKLYDLVKRSGLCVKKAGTIW